MSKILIGPMMKKINEEIERQVNLKIKQYNLTMTQAKIILFLSKSENYTVTQKQLEDFLNVSHPTTVTIVKSLEAKQMIKTAVDDSDRRMKLITLTQTDEMMEKDLKENADQIEQKLLNGFSKEDRELFYQFMQKAYENIVR